jgi:chemotaxis protein methyltransferase CheR
MKRQDFEFLLELLKENAGWEFDETQYFIIDKKISAFIREKNYNSTEDLIADLKGGSRQLTSLVVEALAFSDTSFFRNFEVFHKFQNHLLPLLREKCRATKKLNIWSLGCSTGQEAYSIGMCINNLQTHFADWNIKIAASDLSSLAISKAQRGLYNNFEIQMGLNARTILDYFTWRDDNWKINDNVRNLIEFRCYNMLDKPIASSKFEVVFCRNVLRYFTAENQEIVVRHISENQPQGGYLYLGKHEIVPCIEQYYTPLDEETGAYISKDSGTDGRLQSPFSSRSEDTMPQFVRPGNLVK